MKKKRKVDVQVTLLALYKCAENDKPPRPPALPLHPPSKKELKQIRRAESRRRNYAAKMLTQYVAAFQDAAKDGIAYWQIEQVAKHLGAFVRSDNEKMVGHSVVVNHEDGSHFYINHAWFEEIGKWIVVFSEHQGTLCFHTEDLAFWEQR